MQSILVKKLIFNVLCTDLSELEGPKSFEGAVDLGKCMNHFIRVLLMYHLSSHVYILRI